MNDFQPITVSQTATADRPWLASLVGTNDCNTIALDLTKFVQGVHYELGNLLQPRNVLRSGLPLGKVTATGLYAPFSGPTSEVQTVTVTGAPTGGTYTLTFTGQTTGAIPFNSTAAQVQAALEALSNINPGDVVVGGGPSPTAVTVAFSGQYLGDNVAAMTASGANLTGGTTPGVTVATATAGGAAGASDGTQIFAGFLATESMFAPGSLKTSGALLWYGEVFAAKCPIPFDPTAVTTVAPGVNIHYR